MYNGKMKLLSFILCFFMMVGYFINTETYVSANTTNLLDDATKKVVTAETTKSQDDVNIAQTAVDLLPNGTDKYNLQSRINAVQNDIDNGILADVNLSNAIHAVEKAEATNLQSDVDSARLLVNALPDSSNKTDLTNRLNVIDSALQYSLNLAEATSAVEKAENTRSQTDVTSATILVNNLPNGSDKTNLLNRLGNIIVIPDTTPTNGTITIEYVDEENNKIATDNVMSNLTFKDYTLNAITITGYDLNDSSSKTVSLTSTNNNITVIFKYKESVVPATGKITIEYVDEENNKIATDNVMSNLTFKDYTLNSITIAGYDLDDSSSKTVSLTSTNNNITVIFKYKESVIPPTNGTITIRYIDEENNKISTDKVMSNLTFKDYTLNAITITGYELNDSLSKTVNLTSINNNVTVIFKYKEISITPPSDGSSVKSGSIRIKYLDEDTNQEITDNTLMTDLDFKEYAIKAKDIKGYILDDNSSKVVTLTTGNKDAIVTFNYKKAVSTTTGGAVTVTSSHHHHHKTIKGSIIIQYLDENKNKIMEDTIMDDLSLDTYKLSYKLIDGYELLDVPEKEITLTSDDKDVTIIFNYKKLINCWKQLSNGNWIYYDVNSIKLVNKWININGVWYYFESNGIMITGWYKIDGMWYYFQESGAMKTGWFQNNGIWYYLKSDGSMAIGWIMINNNWYYFNSNGSMVHDTTIENYTLGNDGALIQ